MNISADISTVAFILSAAALVVALLSAALSFWVLSMPHTGVQDENPQPQPPPVLDEEYKEGAWYGDFESGYVRGSFTVRRMPTRGADALRGEEVEWVAYRDGERAFASPDLEDVLRVCEKAE